MVVVTCHAKAGRWIPSLGFVVNTSGYVVLLSLNVAGLYITDKNLPLWFFLGQKKETESGNKRMTFILSLSRGWVDGWSFNLLLSSPHQIILPCSPTRNTDLILVVQRTWRFRSEDVEVSAGLGLVGVAPAQLHVEDLGPNSIGSRKSSRKCSQKPFNSRKKCHEFFIVTFWRDFREGFHETIELGPLLRKPSTRPPIFFPPFCPPPLAVALSCLSFSDDVRFHDSNLCDCHYSGLRLR